MLGFGGSMFFITYDSIRDLIGTFNNFSNDLVQQTALVRSLALVHSNLTWVGSESDLARRQIRVEVVEEFANDFQKKLVACGDRCVELRADYAKYEKIWAEVKNLANSNATMPSFREQIESRMNPLAENLFDKLDKVSGFVVVDAKHKFQESVSSKYLLLGLSVFGLVLVILTTVAFFQYIRQSILDPLQYLRQAMGRVSKDLSTRVEVKKSQVQELGEIASAFNDMVGALQSSEKTIAQQNEMMVQTAKMASLGQMSAGVAHEINNPLAIISGTSQQLTMRLKKYPEIDQETEKFIERINRSVLRISKIVSGLKTFARDSSLDPKTPESLRKILEESMELSIERFRKFECSLEAASIPDVKIACRPTEIEQVLINLLGNALDAILDLPKEQHWVRIETQFNNQKMQIRVIDGGHGIPEEIARKIMDPFFTTKEIGKGTGLGLSISIGILRDHGGDLFLDRSHPNTCFVLELPYLEVALAA
jgi:C4-dicarboxylate-specific signal transduction histidine kinase